MQWTREQYLDLMTFGQAPRPMFCELFGPLVGLEEEWKLQGATPGELDMTAFDWDWVRTVGCGGQTGAVGLPEAIVLEDNAEFIVRRDGLGRTTKLFKKSATIPLPLDWPVATMDDWLKLKPHYQFTESRIDWDQVEAARTAQDAGALVRGGIPGGYDLPRQLMGEERACMAFIDQPELINDILATARETAVAVYERISERLTIDHLSVHEDFAGKSGPLIGPRQMSEFVAPCYRATWDLLASRGTRLFDIDSDGNCNPVLASLIDGGINSMHPCEPAAGMDVVAIREKCGRRLALKGGIDKHVLRRGRDAIRAELEYKLGAASLKTGMVFGLDHRIPNGTPLEDYRFYVDLGREMVGIPPRDPSRTGWARMAF